ncbi:hippurate hydrolase [Arthrobacter stackebrandtii]|uniref:Hippurate hydrolase n=1 Tax=Arthrobacter stackebrandtii TaxID=272161 RepID=A0ABS4YVC2_9MICC|nr:M20 family metallopeptidase [Arthrobacter stackebrandtii]MBP2411883.1 hippurate hydrolase [Arthrobacter stackebrandtii]PYG99089.1 amidohydrolase [Arthrobacter stackebrandtii]
MPFIDAGAAILEDLVAVRRDLHRHPEVGLDLPRTQGKVLAALDGLGLDITLGRETTSVVAVLRGAAPGPTVLLRGDMDALPVKELTGLDYASTNDYMHACGHDLHTAGLIGAARLLAARRDELAGNVVFMFQPGEEGWNGAGVMIGEGVLGATGEKPVAAYAIHVGPGPRGVFMTKPGPILAGANELHITVNGSGGHGSQPHTAVDPVPALLEIGTALQVMATRKFDAFDPVVVSVTQLSAGEGLNVIPDSARLGATVRTLSAASTDTFAVESKRLAEGIAAAHGCTADVEFVTTYPVTTNDAASTAATLDVLRGHFGADRVLTLETALMGSEDFSLVLAEVPGTFVFLNCSPDGVDPATAEFNHSPRVLFDDAVLGDQAAALASLAWSHLGPQED